MFLQLLQRKNRAIQNKYELKTYWNHSSNQGELYYTHFRKQFYRRTTFQKKWCLRSCPPNATNTESIAPFSICTHFQYAGPAKWRRDESCWNWFSKQILQKPWEVQAQHIHLPFTGFAWQTVAVLQDHCHCLSLQKTAAISHLNISVSNGKWLSTASEHHMLFLRFF